MKILYVITKSNWGGAQRHVFDLAVSSKQKGHEVTVALGGSGVLKERLMTASIPTRAIGSLARDINVGDDAASLRDIWGIIRDVRPDILHLHSTKAAGLGAFAGRMLGIKKIIYTVHGFAFNEDRSPWQKILIIFFSWLTMLLSTHVITISERELGQAQMFPNVKHKLRMIYLGIIPPVFYSRGGAIDFIQSKTPEPLGKKIVIGTIAELHPNKGLIYSINAIDKLRVTFPSILYVIISDGEQKAHLEALIKEKKLEKEVVLTGYVEDAAQYLKGFSIFLLPSIKEGLPYTIIEAGYAGLPVVATTVGGIPEIIDDMKSGVLIQPKKIDEIAYALAFLLEHKHIQREYGNALYEKVRAQFDLPTMMSKVFAVYEENQTTPQSTPVKTETPPESQEPTPPQETHS